MDINWASSAGVSLEVLEYKIRLTLPNSIEVLDQSFCESGSQFYLMRDTFCSVSLDTLRDVYNLEYYETSVSVSAINAIGESEFSRWSNTVRIPNETQSASIGSITTGPAIYPAPKISGELDTHNGGVVNWGNVYPTDEQLLDLPVVSDFRLSEIRYKTKENYLDLSAIQLVFANGIETPFFQAQPD